MEAAPQAAKVFLGHYVGQAGLPLPELVQKAAEKLPPTGSVHRKDDITAVKAISWLLGDVDRSHPAKEKIEALFDSAYSRRTGKG